MAPPHEKRRTGRAVCFFSPGLRFCLNRPTDQDSHGIAATRRLVLPARACSRITLETASRCKSIATGCRFQSTSKPFPPCVLHSVLNGALVALAVPMSGCQRVQHDCRGCIRHIACVSRATVPVGAIENEAAEMESRRKCSWLLRQELRVLDHALSDSEFERAFEVEQ